MKKWLATGLLLFVIGAVVLVLYSLRSVTVGTPLADAGQVVLVIARTDRSQTATLQAFSRTADGGWEFELSTPAVIGENGLGWGIGLHRSSARLRGQPEKREGDRKAPEGVFPLLHAYGYPPPSNVNIEFPYIQSTETLICVDDPGSKYYNQVIDIGAARLDRDNLPSHERMFRDDNVYKYAILVGHNAWNPKKGAGSCIFLHVWRGETTPTLGCTAMPEVAILRLLGWLDIDKNPVLVQLTREDYLRLKDAWGLPDVTI